MSHEAHTTSENQPERGRNTSAREIPLEAAWCIEYLREVGGGVTFVELVQLLEKRGIGVKGEHAICSSVDPNLILWLGLSEQAKNILLAFMRHPDVTVSLANWLSYAVDGAIPTLPMAFDLPPGGLLEPHWVPVKFDPAQPTGRLRHKLGYDMVRVGDRWEPVRS